MSGVEGVLLAQGASTLAGLGAAYTQAEAAKAQAKFQAQQLAQNARLAEIQAQDVLARGEEAVRRQRLSTRQLEARQRVLFGVQGIEPGTGTPADIVRETGEIGEEEAKIIRINAARQAAGIRSDAVNLLGQKRFLQLGARQQYQATLVGGGLGAARDIYQGVNLYQGLRSQRASSAPQLTFESGPFVPIGAHIPVRFR